jgi:hypothetical protein
VLILIFDEQLVPREPAAAEIAVAAETGEWARVSTAAAARKKLIDAQS